MVAPSRTTFPPVVTASQWASVLSAVWNRALARRGSDRSSLDGTIAPRVTNAEATQVIRAWTEVATAQRFPLWYQFAAVAYGWDPPDNDALDASTTQADKMYPADLNVQLWVTLFDVAADMDSALVANPRLNLAARFDDTTWLDSVRAALKQDGARATFKIPLPACKDPKTGKPTGRPHKDPKTGKWTCDPVTVDDPITWVGKNFASAALILGLVWLLASDDNNQPRRRRRT